jgi:hypothetical protein
VDSLKPADAYIRSLNIYDQAIYDAVARPLYGHVGRLDCLMMLKGIDTAAMKEWCEVRETSSKKCTML